jgi:hypothetical protein
MSAGGAAWSQSSRPMPLGGDRPPTFHVATKILVFFFSETHKIRELHTGKKECGINQSPASTNANGERRRTNL